MPKCHCGSKIELSECCIPFIEGDQKPETAEQLLRARYSAFVEENIDYIEGTVHPDKKHEFDRDAAKSWAEDSIWMGFGISDQEGGGKDDKEGTIHFTARYERDGEEVGHNEIAEFKKSGGKWYFYDGKLVGHEPYVRETPKVGRNEPCPCGSGKKYKKCCGR